MITTNLTLTNGATSEVPIRVTGITFEVDSKLAVNPFVVFPLTVAIGNSEIVGIDFDETLYSGDYAESITINTLGGRHDIVHSVNIVNVATDTEYLLTAPIIDANGFNYVENTLGPVNGRLTDDDGTQYTPYPITVAEYPRYGILDLSSNRLIDSQQLLSPSTEYLLMMALNVNFGTTFQLVAIHVNDDGTADVYYADENNEFSLLSENTGLNYTVPLDSYKITENLEIPIIPTCAISTVADITTTDVVTIDLSFNTKPLSFTLDDISTTASGALNNLVETGWTNGSYGYTIDFTADVEIADATNVITVSGSLGEYSDMWANGSIADSVSNNFEINTVVEVFKTYHVALDEVIPNGVDDPASIVVNHILWDNKTDIPLVASDDTSTSVLFTGDGELNGASITGLVSGDNSFSMADTQLTHYWETYGTFTFTIEGLDYGTYEVAIGHNRNADAPSTVIGIDTIQDVVINNIECYNETTPHIQVFSSVVIDATTQDLIIVCEEDDLNGGTKYIVNGIDIKRIA